jgi:hypothetical protein
VLSLGIKFTTRSKISCQGPFNQDHCLCLSPCYQSCCARWPASSAAGTVPCAACHASPVCAPCYWKIQLHGHLLLQRDHRNQTISRKGAYIISRRPSQGEFERRCCHQAFLRIFSELTYIRTVGNSTLLKTFTLPNHTITIGVCILETQLLGLLYGGGASFVQK